MYVELLLRILNHFSPLCRITVASLIWTALKESAKVFLVYADFIKDCIFLAIIVQALGGIAELQKSPDWNFASSVSLSRFICHTALDYTYKQQF